MTTKTTTKMTVEEYTSNHGTLCPFCRSDNVGRVTAFDGDMAAGDAWHTAKCFHCGKQWTVQYSLTGYFSEDG